MGRQPKKTIDSGDLRPLYNEGSKGDLIPSAERKTKVPGRKARC